MWFRRKKERVDTDAITRQAEEAVAQLQAQQPRVNAVTSYLERRKNVNGFGHDFEWTLKPKESR